MKSIFLIIILLLVPTVYAELENYNANSYLKLNYQFDSEFELISTNPTSSNIELEINALPLTQYNQELLSFNIETIPKSNYTIKDSKIYLSFSDITSKNFNIKINADVLVNNSIIPIKSKVAFPLKSVLEEYTEQTEYIDITSEMRKKAQELAGNKDDLYEVVFEIGKWVKSNIKYNANQLTSKVVQKSSWVYQNKVGVCDEITNLFISLTRSLGIPARFVYGMAYTNIENNFVSHAWAEVYFPDYGWIPFDITFGQFGRMDPSHIKLQTSYDSGNPTIVYKWDSKNTEFNNKKLEVGASVTEYGKEITKPASLYLRPLVDKLGENSYVPIELKVKNNQEFYLPEMLIITKSPELIQDNVDYTLLKPGELKSIYWIAKGPRQLDPGYIYNINLEAMDTFGESKETNLTFSYGYKIYTETDALLLINYLKENKVSNNFAVLNCSSKDYHFMYENITINCDIKNNMNKKLKDILVCIDTACKSLTLNANENKLFEIDFIPTKQGLNQISVDASYATYKIKNTIMTIVLEDPNLKVTNMNIPSQVDYNENLNISFVIILKAPVKDIQIYLGKDKLFSLDQLDSSKKVTIYTRGKDLLKQASKNLIVKFRDENNKKYEISQQLEIRIINIPFFSKILYLLSLI